MDLEVAWNGQAGWLIPGLPVRGHLVAPSHPLITAPTVDFPRVRLGDGLVGDRILQHLQDGPLTALELSRRTKIALHTIQTQVSRLRKFGRLAKGTKGAAVELAT